MAQRDQGVRGDDFSPIGPAVCQPGRSYNSAMQPMAVLATALLLGASIGDVSLDDRTTAEASVRAAGGGASVLIVDDNVDAALMLSDLLSSIGYATRVAHDAPQALAIAEEYVPDIALLDIGLPAMDGYELARRLREKPTWCEVRLIAVTGYGQSSDRKRSLEAGFDHHLVKPIGLAALQQVIPRDDW